MTRVAATTIFATTVLFLQPFMLHEANASSKSHRSAGTKAAKKKLLAAKALPSNYRFSSAREKRGILFERVIRTKYDQNIPSHVRSGALRTLARMTKKLAPWNLRRSFDHKGDTRPRGDEGPKIVHQFGTVAKATLVLNGVEFPTLLRFSLARPENRGYIPGIAIKVLRSNKDSLNLHLMDSPIGQGNDRNFFARDFANEFKAPRFFESPVTWAAGVIFSLVKKNPNFLPLPKALLDEAGITSDVRNFVLDHTAETRTLILSNTKIPFQQELGQKLKPGLKLSTVRLDGAPIGSLRLETAPIASEFGDNNLFFSHHRD